ncbi:hypothetical protein ZWY2020_027993 [Hordeum vulgare]|nr:hypothetical protein ZWY2020_027993 [Hordeum vulgare]
MPPRILLLLSKVECPRVERAVHAASVDTFNITNDVLSDLCGPEKTAKAEQVDPAAVRGDCIEDPLCSLKVSMTQSQCVDGTEAVTQEYDVPFQLLLEDQRKKRKLAAFERKKAACLQKGPNASEAGYLVESMLDSDNLVGPVKKKFKRIVSKKHHIGVLTPRKSPHLVGKVSSPSLGELPGSGCEAVVVTPSRSPRVLAYAGPSSLIGSGLSAKVVILGTSTRVSREASMAKNLVSQDMSQMDYCQLLVDDLKRVVIRYQQGTTRGKDVIGCGISPLLMYLDCLIHGKKPVIDLRTPCINFMDQVKLCEIADADLVKKGDDDLANWVFGNMPFHGVSVDSKKLANKYASDIGYFDCLDRTERKFSTSDGVFDGEQSKSTGGDTIVNAPIPEKVSTEAATELGSTQAISLNPLATEPSVVAGVCSPMRATAAEPTVVLISKSPCASGTTEDDNTIAGMRKSGKSTGATVARTGGKNGVIARRKLTLEPRNITSSKRAARLPLKWCSPVLPMKKYSFAYLHEAQKLKGFVLSEDGLKKHMHSRDLLGLWRRSTARCPAVDVWKGEFMYNLVFGPKNEILREELPAEIRELVQ